MAAAASMVPLAALPDEAATTAAWSMHVVALSCALVWMLRAAASGDGSMRAPRLLFAAALFASLSGGLVSVASVAVTGTVPIPSIGDPVALLYLPLAAYGFWRIPQRPGSRIGGGRLAADGAVAVTALLFVSWTTVIGPIVVSGRFDALALATLLAYPLGDVFLAALVLALLPRARADLRPFLNRVAAGLLLIALSDSGFVALLAGRGQLSFGWPDVTLQAGMVLLAYAARWRAGTTVVPDQYHPSAFDRNLPYVPVVLAAAVGLHSAFSAGGLRLPECVLGAALLGAVMVRQALLARDLTVLSQANQHAAEHDELTGLANRKRFFAQLAEHLVTPGVQDAAVLLIDLDGFKDVNDTRGHEAGDRVLVDFADRLRAVAPALLVARLGGDEFAVLVRGSRPDRLAVALAEQVAAPQGGPLPDVRCSAGIAVVRHQDGPADVLHRADLAMYSAKRSTTCSVAVFREGLAEEAERRQALASGLAVAVDRGELHVVYQPLYRLRSGELAGAEALLRWTHPALGAVAPDEFIPLAEETGQIHAIGAWVLEQAVAQCARWQHAGRHLPRIFVNVSGTQFTDELPGVVERVLDRHGVPAARLTLEITESQLPALAANDAICALRRAGVKIALDDFGAGYSSLAQLARLPVDVLKIDRDFVRNLGERTGRAVLDAVVELAGALGVATVAEGIEDVGQAAEATNAGVDYGQGYLFSRPEPAHVFERRLPSLPALPAQRPAVEAAVRVARPPDASPPDSAACADRTEGSAGDRRETRSAWC